MNAYFWIIIIGPITPQNMSTNYLSIINSTLMFCIQFVSTAWCVIGSTKSKNKHLMPKHTWDLFPEYWPNSNLLYMRKLGSLIFFISLADC